MFGNLFGGKKPTAKSGQPKATPPEEGPRLVSLGGKHPWDGAPDAVGANFAVADLINNLPRRFTIDGRIHAETLLAASGAIAGYAAQRALFAQLAAEGVAVESSGLIIVNTQDGRRRLMGDRLNAMLLPQSNSVSEASEKLWSLAQGAAVSAGLDPAQMPDVGPMFAHVAGTIGSGKEGTTSVTDRKFQLPTLELMKIAWPLALSCFNGELSGKVLKPPVIVSQRWRPAITAITANKMIRDVAGVLPPLVALTIVMETAIYASKLMPEEVGTV
jgi:hypothetical protein